MSHGILISDAVSIAMHSMAVMASRDGLSSAHDIAGRIGVSEFHLAKVLQRLAKSGLLESSRGPQGGFALARKSSALTLLDVYEAIEGPLKDNACLMRKKTCEKKTCIMGNSISSMWSIFRKHLGSTKISDIAEIFRQEEVR